MVEARELCVLNEPTDREIKVVVTLQRAQSG